MAVDPRVGVYQPRGARGELLKVAGMGDRFVFVLASGHEVELVVTTEGLEVRTDPARCHPVAAPAWSNVLVVKALPKSR